MMKNKLLKYVNYQSPQPGGIFSFLRNRKVIWISASLTTLTGYILLKDYMQGPWYIRQTDETGKVFIVTGASSGIGEETAKELAKRGGTVYMACRDLEKCEKVRKSIVFDTNNTHVYCRKCDLASVESIRQFAEAFKKEQPKLNVLINNAGVMRCPRQLTRDGFEMQLGVNHIGHFLLTNLLLDHLKKTAPSRIVNVSSLAHTRGEIKTGDLNSEQSYDEAAAYNQSKLANLLFTRELAKRLDGTGVTVNALHPGIVDTNIVRHMGFFNNFFAKIFLKPFVWPFIKNARNGAQTTLYLALDPDLENVSGSYFKDNTAVEAAPAANDDITAKWLWAVSEKWTRLSS